MSHEIIEIDRIILDDRCQCRVTEPGEDYIEELADVLRSGQEFETMPVGYEDEGGRIYLADGRCRRRAYLLLGRKEMPLDVRSGGLRGAILHAVKANRHGNRRTRKDVHKAIRTLLLFLHEDNPSATKSNREIALAVGCDDGTVKPIREDMERRGEIHRTETRTDSLGRQQPAAKPPKADVREIATSTPPIGPASPIAPPAAPVPAAAPAPAEEKPKRRVSGDATHQARAEAVARAAEKPVAPAQPTPAKAPAAKEKSQPNADDLGAARKADAKWLNDTLAAMVRRSGDYEEKYRPNKVDYQCVDKALKTLTVAIKNLTRGA